MSDDTVMMWSITLVVGLVVAVVAVILLQLLLRQVHRIERDALAIWEMGKLVAANTATTWMLTETSQRLDLLADEAQRHDQLLRASTPPRAV